MIELYEKLVKKFPIKTIEDPFDQDDFESYKRLTKKIGTDIQIVGDDLLVTNPKRVQTGIDDKLCNALLLKVN
jgi:enolase